MRARVAVVLVFFAVCLRSSAQQQLRPMPLNGHARPSIGLALEGGKAIGLAEIGVLEWMEQHRIPVDYVAGTSMGGLIAGSYATGLRASELHALFRSIDWQTALNGELDFRDLSFRRKEDHRAYPSTIEFGMKQGIRMPEGLNSGQYVDLVLDRLALPYSTVNNFDELPIPFRCIATNLTSRSMHVFGEGRLSDALRATMSMPGIFAPVHIDRDVYVDGGILNNLPSDIVRGMGADVVLAIHVEPRRLRDNDPLSPVTVVIESFTAATSATEKRGMDLADHVVRVDLTEFDPMDFTAVEKMIERGYAAAESDSAALMKYCLDEQSWNDYLERRDSRRKAAPHPQFVEVATTNAHLRNELASDLNHFSRKPMNDRNVEREVMTAAGTGRFSAVRYRLVERDGVYGLHIDAAEKPYSSAIVTPLLVVDGSEYKDVRFAAGARVTLFDFGAPGAELRADLSAGSSYRLATEYFRLIASSPHWFVASRATLDNAPLPIYSHQDRLAEYRRSATIGEFDLGYLINRFSEIRAGYEVGWSRYTRETGDAVLPSLSGRERAFKARYRFDHLDDPVIPRTGFTASADFALYHQRPGTLVHVPALDATIEAFHPLHASDNVFLRASAGSTFGRWDTGIPLFTLGGPLRLASYGSNEIFTNQYALVQVGYMRRIAKLSPLAGKGVYLTSSYELAKSYGTPDVTRLPMDVSSGVIIHTLLGPAYVGGSWGDSGHRKIFFQIGRIF